MTAIIEPDSTIADQYRQTMFVIGGRAIIGTVIDQREEKVRIATDMTDPKRHRHPRARQMGVRGW